MNDGAELRSLRGLLADLAERVARLESDPPPACLARAAKTISLGGYPTGSPTLVTFALQFQDVTGAEAEGAAGSVAAHAGHQFGVCLSGTLPPVGSEVIAEFVDYCWVFRY